MAVNDLMMKIQLIVESGKSSAELNRLQQALKALQTQLTALDRTQLAPLTRDLNAVKQAAAQLKTVNLGNFATQIDAVKQSFIGLGLATGTLDQLRTAYQQLNAQLTSGDLQRYQAQLKAVGDRLREAKALSLTRQGTTRNTTYERLNRDLGQYNALILSATKSIVTQQQAILGLKNQLAALPKIKIDPTISTTLKELVKNAQGKTLRVDDYQKSFASMQGFNNELLNQQRLLDQSRLNAQKYQETLAKLRNEAQRAAIPDLTMGGTRNLVADLNQAQSAIRDLRSRGLLPLQNDLRNLQSTKSFQKSLNIAPLDAAVKRLKAELPDLKQKLDLATSTGNVADVAKYSTRIASNKQEIIEKELKSAQLNEAMVNTLGKQIANTRNLTNETKNQLAVLSNEEKAIQSLIAAQKQSAKIAAQTIKSRPGGIVDTAAAKAAAQAEANLYKNNIASLKQYLASRKAAATEDANLVKQQIQSAQQRLSQQQLTKAQWSAERAEIQANIATEKARSQVYQQTLRDQQRSVKEAIQSEKEREQSLKTQIKTLTQLGTAQAQVKAIQLQSDLASSKNRQGDLRTQVRDIEQAAKAEIERIRTLDQSSQALRRQGNAVSSLGRLFREAGGPVKEFSAAIKFALGPQMAGFAAAGSIISLLTGFVAANKEIENLKRGLNAITGSSELYFQELTNTANRLGQSIMVVSDSYLQLVASSKGTRLEGEATRQIFEAVSNALVMTGADAVRSRRAFLALAQMMSKGQIYAEELRQQLSEALPGAVNIFSRALGVAPQKLLEMMKAGEVSSDALILFMEELKKTFPPVTKEMFTFSQKAALLQNTMQRLFVEIGDTGIWKSLGNGILSANKAISTATDNIGTFGDEVKTTFDYLSTIGELTGIGTLLGSAFEGFVDVSKSVVDEAIGVLEGLPAKAAEIAIQIRAALQQAALVAAPREGFFDTALAEAQRFGQYLEQQDRELLAFVTSLVPDFGKLFDRLVSSDIESRILQSEAALSKLQATAQLTKEQFDALSRSTKERLFQGIIPANADQGRAIAEQALADEKSLIEELKKKRVLNQQIQEERKADLSATDEAAETRKYLDTFNTGYRTAMKSAKEAIAGAQKAAELSAKVGTVQDKQAANKIIALKKIQDIENTIYETQVRSKEITDAAIKNRIDDERSLLELSLDRASAVAQSEANAENLRKGRQDQGIYFTDDMKKASRDAQQARKLEQQALELSERAAQSKNEVEKRGLLENSKYLQQQAAQLNQSAGETYRLKQNYEALEAIAKQLTKAGEAELKIRQDIAEAERLATQAEEARAKAIDPNALRGERDEWSKIADERARAAAQKFSDAGLTKQAEAMGQLRVELEKIQQEGKAALENLIVEKLKEFNLQNEPDYQKVFAELGSQFNDLRRIENDLVAQLNTTQSPESKANINERLAQIRRDFYILNEAYKRVQDQLQIAIESGAVKGIEFPSYLESKGAVNAVPQTLKETQSAVNQSAPIVFRSVLQAPTVTPEVAAPTTLSTAFKPVSVPVTFIPANDSAAQVVVDFQKALQGLPAQSLAAPVTVDTKNLKSSEEKIKSIIYALGLLDESFNDNQVTAWLKTLAGFDTFPLDKIEGIQAAIQRVNETLAQPGTLETKEKSLRIKALLEELLKLKQAVSQSLPVDQLFGEIQERFKGLEQSFANVSFESPINVNAWKNDFSNAISMVRDLESQLQQSNQAGSSSGLSGVFSEIKAFFVENDSDALRWSSSLKINLSDLENNFNQFVSSTVNSLTTFATLANQSIEKTDFSSLIGKEVDQTLRAMDGLIQQLSKTDLSILGINGINAFDGFINNTQATFNQFTRVVNDAVQQIDFSNALGRELDQTLRSVEQVGQAIQQSQARWFVSSTPYIDAVKPFADQAQRSLTTLNDLVSREMQTFAQSFDLSQTTEVRAFVSTIDLLKAKYGELVTAFGQTTEAKALFKGFDQVANGISSSLDQIGTAANQQQVVFDTAFRQMLFIYNQWKHQVEQPVPVNNNAYLVYQNADQMIRDAIQSAANFVQQIPQISGAIQQIPNHLPLLENIEKDVQQSFNVVNDLFSLIRQPPSFKTTPIETKVDVTQASSEGSIAGVAVAQGANQALAQNPVTLTAQTNLPQVTQELQTVGQQARLTVAELQKINQLPPGQYTIQAANPAEQQLIEEKVKLLQQNKNLVVNVQWITTGVQTVDGFTKGLEKKAVVTITAKADPAQAAAEGAKVGQAAADAAKQALLQKQAEFQAALKLTTDSSNYDLFSGFDGSKLNQGIQVAMDQAKATVKTSVAQMNQELLNQLGASLDTQPLIKKALGDPFKVKIETVVDQTSLEGWKRQVQRLSAEDNRVSLRADTAELDQEFRRIDGQFAEWNRTAGNSLKSGFVSATEQAQNFGTLVDQVNQKMRAIQNPEKLPPFKPVIEPVVEVKDTYQQMQQQLNQQNPIQVSADAAPLVGEIQQKLNELRASGATNIKVTLDQETGQLIVTANTDPANEAMQDLIARIESSDAVLRVRVVYQDPGFSSSPSSASSDKKRWGGYISGYGGGDRIRALLEPGEFVLRKEAVKALGLSSLIKLNNLGFNAKIPKPSARSVDHLPIPRFASGGLVSGQPIVINVPGSKSIQVQGSRDSAMALVNLLTRVGRAV